MIVSFNHKKNSAKMSQRKREREFFEADNQACAGHVTFC